MPNVKDTQLHKIKALVIATVLTTLESTSNLGLSPNLGTPCFESWQQSFSLRESHSYPKYAVLNAAPVLATLDVSCEGRAASAVAEAKATVRHCVREERRSARATSRGGSTLPRAAVHGSRWEGHCPLQHQRFHLPCCCHAAGSRRFCKCFKVSNPLDHILCVFLFLVVPVTFIPARTKTTRVPGVPRSQRSRVAWQCHVSSQLDGALRRARRDGAVPRHSTALHGCATAR